MILNVKTVVRRLLQPFWTIFNKILKPFSSYGIINGVSGGNDSRTLLELLASYPMVGTIQCMIVVVNHYARKICINESIFIYERARILGFLSIIINIYNRYIFFKKNEKFLRAKRYGVLWDILYKKQYSSLLTAHTKDDIIESYIMYALGWGGGNIGSSIPIIRKTKLGFLLRPLLYFRSFDIKNILSVLNIFNYFDDLSNITEYFKRAIVRNRIVIFLDTLEANNRIRLYNISQYAYSIKMYFQKKSMLIYQQKKKYLFLLIYKYPSLYLNIL